MPGSFSSCQKNGGIIKLFPQLQQIHVIWAKVAAGTNIEKDKDDANGDMDELHFFQRVNILR